MAISNSVFLAFFLVCSWALVGYSQGGDLMSCIQKLMPCQPYLKAPTAPPPPCCQPLKDIIADHSQCLCDVLNDPDILKGLNVTLDDGLNLVKSCGAPADTSVCKKGFRRLRMWRVATNIASALAAAPSTNSQSTSPPPKNAASVVSDGGCVSVAAAAIAIMLSLF